MYWAALTLAFYGFPRASEYTSPTLRHYDSCRHDGVTLDHNSMRVRREVSKTDQYRQSAIILICRTGTPTCPVKAMQIFWHMIAPVRAPLSSPFTRENSLLKDLEVVSLIIKSLLCLTRVNPLYSSHSYRVGAATTAATASITESLIQPWEDGDLH